MKPDDNGNAKDWILCSEQMPALDRPVWTTNDVGYVEKAPLMLTQRKGDYGDRCWVDICYSFFYEEKRVIAWMPCEVPEPYREPKYWIHDGHHLECPKCGASFCDRDREGDIFPRDYCPACGTKLEDKDEYC